MHGVLRPRPSAEADAVRASAILRTHIQVYYKPARYVANAMSPTERGGCDSDGGQPGPVRPFER